MNKELNRNDDFVKQIFSKYAVSSVLAMLATSVSGIIDTMIVGHFLGETGLSAMSLVSPMYLLYYTIGAVVGMGGSIAANFAVGRNDYDSYRSIFSLSTATLAAMSVIITALGLPLTPQLVVLFGGAGIIGGYMREYLTWYIIFGGFTLLSYIPLYFLKIEGKPQASSYLFLISSVLNMVLSWLFMSPICNMGIKGASLATGLSMAFIVISGSVLLLKDSRELRFARFKPGQIGEILLCGSPNGCNNLFNALKLFAINYVLISIGAEMYLPSFAMIKSVSDLLSGFIIGISAALMPIIGVFYEERDCDSIRRVCRAALKKGAILTAALAAAVGFFPGLWCALFNVTDSMTAQGAQNGLICLALSFLAAFMNLMLIGYFNTIKRQFLANLIHALRLIVCLVPFALILGNRFGAVGVWAALIAADALTLVILLIIMLFMRKKRPELDMFLLDTIDEGKGEISFSVRNTVDDIIYASTKITCFCEENDMSPKKTMRVSLALEEMLTVIILHCMDSTKESYIDIRILNLGDNVLLRIRNTGKIFDPIHFYEENKDNEEMEEQLLGIKMIVNSAKDIVFRETFGINNLTIIF